MALILIGHFYNEAFLLPYWIRHHLPLVDHAVLIDYQSTDDSVAIIRALAPTWEVRPSRNDCFDAAACDAECMMVEREFGGWKVVLNTTEFLFHDRVGEVLARWERERPEVLAVSMQGVVMVDRATDRGRPVSGAPLYQQRFTGYVDEGYRYRGPRWVHRGRDGNYSPGRHGTSLPSAYDPELLFLWHAWSPFDQIKARKLQIQTRISASDRFWGRGAHHIVDEAGLEAQFREQTRLAIDLDEVPACRAMRDRFRRAGFATKTRR